MLITQRFCELNGLFQTRDGFVDNLSPFQQKGLENLPVIRKIGNIIQPSNLGKFDKLSDILYKNAVPSCVYGACKEGKMTCGRAAEMREKYRVEL